MRAIIYCTIIWILAGLGPRLLATNPAYKADAELREAKKCARVIPYFEKKLGIPTGILHSIALQESGKRHSKHNFTSVWPWAVNSNGKSYYFDNKKQAVKFVEKQLRSGKKNIDVGCMQINLKAHPDAFRDVEQAFSPRRNVEYGANFLKNNFNKLGNWSKAIGRYHSKNAIKAKKYQRSVTEIAKLIRQQHSKLEQRNFKKQYMAKWLRQNNLQINNGQNGNNHRRRKASNLADHNDASHRWFPEQK